jgi:hypothetical protein
MDRHERADRIVDIASVVLISVAAVLTALCGYQSGRWGGEQSRLYSLANANRLHSAEAADRANALTTIDVSVFLHYVEAIDAGNARLADFLFRRFRPEFLPAMRAWLAARPLHNTDAPSSPFVMRQYSLKTRGEAELDEALATANFSQAVAANRHSDDFLLLTVIFAAVSFLAGISTKMSYPRHAIVIAVAFLATIYGIVRLTALPFL